jgi:hypothetical protein
MCHKYCSKPSQLRTNYVCSEIWLENHPLYLATNYAVNWGIDTIKIVDPANTNNELYISSTDRLLLQDAAEDAIAVTYWSDIIW